MNDLVLERAQTRRRRDRPPTAESARPAVFDVTDYDAVVAAIDEGGPVDILVNNAGNAGRATTMGMEDLARLVETDPADWEGFIKVNLYGVMYAVRAALPGMIDGELGSDRHRHLRHRARRRDAHGRVLGGEGRRRRASAARWRARSGGTTSPSTASRSAR